MDDTSKYREHPTGGAMIYVLAGNAEQARQYARDRIRADPGVRVQTLNSPRQVRGAVFREGDEYVKVGTWRERRDLTEIEDNLAWGGFPVEETR